MPTTRIAIPIAEPDERVVERELVERGRRDVACVLPRVRLVARDLLVEPDVAELHPPEPDDRRAVRILLGVGRGVVLAVHRDPLARPHPGRDPDHEPARHRRHGVQRQRPVRQPPVQVDGGDRGRELGHEKAGDDGGEEVPEHRRNATTYWSVGCIAAPPSARRPRTHMASHRMTPRLNRMPINQGTSSSRWPVTVSRSTGTPARAYRDRRRGRHPPPEPAVPLPVEGSAVPRGAARVVRRLARARRPGDRGRRARAGRRSSGCVRAAFRFFEERPDFVRLVRWEALEGGPILRDELAVILRPLFDRGAAFLEREMDAGRLRRYDARQLLLTGYGAVLSYLSDAPLMTGLLDIDPLSPDALAARREHVIDVLRNAVAPEPSDASLRTARAPASGRATPRRRTRRPRRARRGPRRAAADPTRSRAPRRRPSRARW